MQGGRHRERAPHHKLHGVHGHIGGHHAQLLDLVVAERGHVSGNGAQPLVARHTRHGAGKAQNAHDEDDDAEHELDQGEPGICRLHRRPVHWTLTNPPALTVTVFWAPSRVTTNDRAPVVGGPKVASRTESAESAATNRTLSWSRRSPMKSML